MCAWKWSSVLALLGGLVVVSIADASFFGSELEDAFPRSFLVGTEWVGTDNRIQRNGCFLFSAKNIAPAYDNVCTKSVSIYERILFEREVFFAVVSDDVVGKIKVPEENQAVGDLASRGDWLERRFSFFGGHPSVNTRHGPQPTHVLYNHFSSGGDIARRRIPDVAELQHHSDAVFSALITCGSAVNVCAHFRLPNLLCDFNAFFGIVGGAARVMQCSDNGDERDERQNHSRGSRYEHPESPLGHSLLGIKIAAIALHLPLTLYLVFFGYKIADRGFDAFESGRRVHGVGLLIAATVVACGFAFFGVALGAWLLLDGGLEVILSMR